MSQSSRHSSLYIPKLLSIGRQNENRTTSCSYTHAEAPKWKPVNGVHGFHSHARTGPASQASYSDSVFAIVPFMAQSSRETLSNVRCYTRLMALRPCTFRTSVMFAFFDNVMAVSAHGMFESGIPFYRENAS